MGAIENSFRILMIYTSCDCGKLLGLATGSVNAGSVSGLSGYQADLPQSIKSLTLSVLRQWRLF